MVNIPFVSEAFQRTFRQRFPSQTSTGRDLHVSDIVIPIVDFTPTSEGADLPNYLQLSRSKSITEIDTTTSSASAVTFITTSGFYRIALFLSNRLGQNDKNTTLRLDLDDGSSNFGLGKYTTPNQVKDELTIFVPANFNARYTFSYQSGADGELNMSVWQIADVNGNLNFPSGYNPE